MDKSIKILSDLTHYMKYAKYLPNKERRETYEETVTRNKNMHLKRFPEIKEEIEGAYKDVYDKKVLPSMRSMQFAGTAIEVNPKYFSSYNNLGHCYTLLNDREKSFEAFSKALTLNPKSLEIKNNLANYFMDKLWLCSCHDGPGTGIFFHERQPVHPFCHVV